MACSIIRNKQTNEIEQVLAPNSKPSRLYNEILQEESDKEEALKLWAQVYTSTFKKKFGDWENGKAKGELDENGEPLIKNVIRKVDSSRINGTSILSEAEQNKVIGESIVLKLANSIAANIGSKYNIISPEQARKLTENLPEKWNGEGSFYLNGQTYFLKDHFTVENILHEYSHPLFDAVFVNNRDLFDKLLSDVLATPEGQRIRLEVQVLYPEQNETDSKFAKELLTRALTVEAKNQVDGIENSKGFKAFIDKVLFAFKQMFRKLFGSAIKIDKLSTNTSLKDLAKMLRGDKFDIDTDIVTEKDSIQFARDVTEFVKSLEEVDNHQLSTAVHRFYALTTNQLTRIRKNKNYAEARKMLVDENTKKGLLQGIKATLENTEIDEKLTALLTDAELREKNATNFVHSILQLEILTKKIQAHMKELVKNGDTQETLNNLFYYDLLIRNWEKFIEETNVIFFDAGMEENSELGSTLSSIESNIKTIKRYINKAYTPGLVDVLKDSLAPLIKGIDEYYSDWIADAKKKGAPQKFIDDKQKEWDDAKLTDQKLNDILQGKHGDTNYFSAYAEAFTNSPDPIVGGFAMFLKNNYNVVEAEFQRDMNDFIREIDPLLDKAGYSRTNFVSLMSKLVFKDKYTYFDTKTGENVTKERWTFLNQFKHVNVHLQKLKNDLEKAQEIGDDEAVNTIVAEQKKHLRDFFHQEYKDEYYDRENIYESYDNYPDLKALAFEILGVKEEDASPDEIEEARKLYIEAAQQVYKDKYMIINQIKESDSLNYDDKYYIENAEEKKLLWRQYSRLASPTDLNGNSKEGTDKLMAAIEKKYRKESNKFFEWVPIEGQFEFALNMFEQSIVDGGDPVGSDAYKEKRDAWIKNNTVISYTPEFYAEKNRILLRLKQVMANLPEEIRNSIDSTAEMETMLGVAAGFRDQHGQIIGSELTEASKEKIKKVQESIIAKRAGLAGFTGLTADEMTEMMLIYNRSGGGKNLTTDQRKRLNELNLKKETQGVSNAVKIDLQSLYSELSELQDKEPTDYYLDIMDNWFQKMGQPAPTRESLDLVLRPEQYTKLFKLDPAFEKWFKENHVRKEVPEAVDGKITSNKIVVYERLFIWNRSRPNNEEHYEQTKLSSGEVLLAKPNLSYFYRSVKDEISTLKYLKDKTDLTENEKDKLSELLEKEASGTLVSYRTEKIVGKTIDNKGNFLPKTIADGGRDEGGGTNRYQNADYDKLRRSDPAAFAVLEKMKEYHLKHQEDSPRESKLYMEIPRYRSMAVEAVLAPKKGVNKGKQLWYNLKSKFVKRNDDYDDNLNFNPSSLVSTNMFDEEIRKIPVTGLYDLNPEEVSMNILDGMMQYRHSVMHQKKLIELNPVAQAFQSVLKDPRNAVETGKFSKWFYSKFAKIVPIKDPNASVRQRAITNLYEREFEGKNQSIELINRFPAVQKVKSNISTLASMGFFALNLPSAFKNKIAAQQQGLIEAAGGRFLNLSSLAIGKLRAGKMLAQHSSQIYSTRNKSLDTQLLQIFNPVQDMFEQMTKTQFGRSVTSDIADLSILMGPRKFLQTKATLDVFCGMMYHIKVEQITKNGKKEIPYIDAFEIVNGQIELKKGIDKKYAAGGKEFNAVKNRVHEVVNRLEGTYSRMDMPELNRNFFFGATVFMKKYFTSMLMNHIAVRRPSAALGTISTGNYANLVYIARGVMKYGKKYFMFMNEEERASLQKVGAQAASIIIMNMLVLGTMLGYHEDDKERFKRMLDRSGDYLSDSFDAGGWLANQELVIALGVLTENGTWYNPKLFANTVIGLPTPSALLNVGFVMPFDIVTKAVTGDVYKDDVGPYWFQKEGGSKALADIAKIFGFTGSTLDPVKAVKAIEANRKGVFK